MEETSDIDWNFSTIRRRDQPSKTNALLTNITSDNQRVIIEEAEQPRKYRLRKRHWQPDEDTLGEILQEELMAWRDMPLGQQTVRRTLRSPTGLISKEDNKTVWDLDEQRYAGGEFADQTTSHHEQTDSGAYKFPLTAATTKKSYFLEGSMNQTSRGTASVWTDIASVASTNSRPASAFSDYESEPSTPGNGRSSRMSLSSVDINEFKPLPPTPTTFKATMRRLGHKLKPVDASSDQKDSDRTPKASKPSRKGLRKSLSTWKFFDSTASEADDEAVPDLPKTEHKTIRNTASSRTLKLLSRHKQQPQADPALALLDERKRKAEIAYAEQFGKSKKRHKAGSSPGMKLEFENDEPEPITMRRRSFVPTTSSSSQFPGYQEPFLANTETLPPPLILSTSSSTIKQRISHRRNSSQESTGSQGTDRDRLKRASRSELEKENQHLRELLRQRGKQDSFTTDGLPESSGKSPRKSEDFGNQDSTPARERMRAALSSHPVSDSDILTSTVRPSSSESESVSIAQSEGMPPIPALPPTVVNHGILRPVTNKTTSVSHDTATVKRRGPVTTLGRAIELPRPLSMVLEGLEDELDDNDEGNKDAITEKLSTGRRASTGAKGSDLPGLKDSKENWDWPEDVF